LPVSENVGAAQENDTKVSDHSSTTEVDSTLPQFQSDFRVKSSSSSKFYFMSSFVPPQKLL